MKKVLATAMCVLVLIGAAVFFTEKTTKCASWRAYPKVQDAVRSRLVSPVSAVFPGSSGISRQDLKSFSACYVEMSGHVDSQNSFGAVIRSDFSARIIGGEINEVRVTAR